MSLLTPPVHRCPRQRVTEGTAMAPWNGPNHNQGLLMWLVTRVRTDRLTPIRSTVNRMWSTISTQRSVLTLQSDPTVNSTNGVTSNQGSVGKWPQKTSNMCDWETPTYSRSGADDKHRKVRRVSGQAEHRCLEVLVMSTEVDERYQLGRVLADFFHRPRVTVVKHLSTQRASFKNN